MNPSTGTMSFTGEYHGEAQREESAEFHDPYNERVEEDEEEDDALSLCDLPIYGGEAADYWESHGGSSGESLASSSSSSYSSAYDEQEDEFFEFSSSFTRQEPDNIVFCGKLIPYKKEQSLDYPKKVRASRGVVNAAPLENYVKSARKVSGVKPKWYLVAFGLARFQGHMDMRDIKKRQIKRTTSSGSSPVSCISKMNVRAGGQGEIVKADRVSSSKGLSALLRVIGCTGQSANSVVKASFGCVSQI